jgi:hypothetical protein
MLELGRFWGYYSNCAKRRIPRLRLVMLELNLPAWKSVATTRSSTAWRLRSCMRRSKPSTSGSSPCAGTPTASHTHPPAQRRRDHRRSGDRRTGSPALRRPGRRDGDADRRGPGPGCPQDPIPSPLHPPPFDLRGSAHPSALPELSQVRRSPHRRRALGDGVLRRRWPDRRLDVIGRPGPGRSGVDRPRAGFVVRRAGMGAGQSATRRAKRGRQARRGSSLTEAASTVERRSRSVPRHRRICGVPAVNTRMSRSPGLPGTNVLLPARGNPRSQSNSENNAATRIPSARSSSCWVSPARPR